MCSIRSERKSSLFKDFVLAVFLSVACYLFTAMPAAYAEGGYALEVGGGRTVTINDDKDVLRLGRYTYEFWMKDLQGPTGVWRNVFYKGSTNSSWGRGPLVALRPNDPGVHFDHSTGTGQSTLDTYEGVPLNEWIHIAIVLTALNGEQIIYQGGVQAAVRSGVNLTDTTQPSVLRLGVEANIVLDDFRVWNYARTQTEIQQDMSHELKGYEEGLVGYWKFNEGEGTTAYDSSPNENHGTIVGALWTKDAAPIAPGPPPAFAYDPSPANGLVDVPRDVVLSWKPGAYAPTTNGHKVYFSENFTDVNEGIGGIAQDTNSYTPAQRLDFNKTYYWRVDEVNGPPDFTVYKGRVWSFTTELFSYPIAGANITATASSQFNPNTKPENTINGSGLDENDLHSNEQAGIWVSSLIGPQPTWIQYEFDRVYKLHQMWVWNHNTSLEPVLGFGFKDVTIEYSTNGTAWAVLANVPEFARAPGLNGYAHNTTVDLAAVPAKYVKLTVNSNWGGILPQYGLSEVRFFYVPVLAREPNPASGATDVPLGTIDQPTDVTLSFRAGREAAKHNVYFSTDRQAVIDGTISAVSVPADRSYARYGPLPLDLGKAYYWRVDEVNEAKTPATWQGELWNFTTQQYFVVDDFEDYNDFQPDRIFDTWIDGWNVPANGSQVGYAEPPFAEKTIIHSGKQSMPFSYDNTAGVTYSEAERTFASPQDWTLRGAKTLSLWFRGNPVAFLESPPGTFTISAGGADIWGTADQFRFVYKQLSGDGSIVAQVLSVQNTDPWAKAGPMIRETLDPGSRFAAVYITPGNGCRFQLRSSTGGSATSDTSVVTAEQIAIRAPYWVKLERTGNAFKTYYSRNPATDPWHLMVWSPQTVNMSANAYIGLALTSHQSGVMCVAKFSDVSTTGGVTGAWQMAEIGVAQPSNNPAPLYVVLQDSANKSATVKHSDSAATNISTWTGWNIDLSAFTGVNPRAVKKMIIGVGDRLNPQPAAGRLYFDDIRLYPQR